MISSFLIDNIRLNHMDHPSAETDEDSSSSISEEQEGSEDGDDKGPWELFISYRYAPLLLELINLAKKDVKPSPRMLYDSFHGKFSLEEVTDFASRLNVSGFLLNDTTIIPS